MKKIFTLISVALAATSSFAQTESWSVANEDGTLKTDYVANSDANAMSVVEFSTAHVKGTHTSGPVAGYIDAETTPLEAKVDNSWGNLQKKDLSKDGSVAPFYYVQGKGNPVNLDKVTWEEITTDGAGTGTYRANWEESYYSPDGSAGLPKNGTYVTLTPSAAGKMKVAVWINKGSRDIYVVKSSDAKALAFGTDITVSGYINGSNNEVEDDSPLKGYMAYQESIDTKGTEGTEAYVIGKGNQAAWVYLTFAASAGETYYIFNKNTQIGFSGYEFSTDAAGISTAATTVDDNNAPEYNLLGQKVNSNVKNQIVIKNGKKYVK